MLRSILNPGKASSVASLRSAMEKWEEQLRSCERKKDAHSVEEKIPESILMATLESLCPPSVEAHLRLNHSRLKTYPELRTEILMLLETNIGASLRAPEAAAGTSGLWQTKGDKGGKGKGKGDQKGKQQKPGSGN
eukprot:4411792-Amphidinium_carterae.1